jgi:Tfp pilus assembly protein PilX
MKRLLRDEKGASLVMVLILLLISGLIIGPLLSYMGTGLITGEVYEMRTDELYAADAGIEDAVWKIQNKDGYLPCSPSSYSRNYTITDVNGKSVAVDITCEYAVDGMTYTYRVLSTATGDGSGTVASVSGTQIEAYVSGVSTDYAGLLDNVITSQNGIDYSPPSRVDINYPEGHGPVDYYDGTWPTPDMLADFYWPDVKDEMHYDGDTEIDLKGTSCPPGPIYINDEENNSWPWGLGPLYVDGGLEILNSSNDPATLTLNGTIYITGDTLITPNKEMTLDLNGQTIFVASDSADPQKALWIGGKCSIIGPGCIIAVGDVYFEPNIPVGMTEPIFILSVSGETTLQPGGDFYGAIAGSVEVTLQPGTSLDYPEAGFGDDINFPGFGEPKQLVYSIYSWEVIPLSPDDLGE